VRFRRLPPAPSIVRRLGSALYDSLLLIALVAVICAAVMVGLVMAGVGVLMVAIVAGCIALGLLFSAPFMLPLLIPIAIIWVLVSRNRKHSKSN